MKYLLKKINYKLLVILSLAALVRFGGLNWCLPYTPHPDEWNMAAAVTRLSWENKQSLMLRNKLNPQFFAYGQFPLYLTYFSARMYNLIPWISIKEINILEAIFFLRFWSAVAGVGTVYLVYLITKKLTPTTHPRLTTHNPQLTPLLASLLAAFTPGLIQISHFGTTESFLSFFFLLILLLSFKIMENPRLKYFIFPGISLGLALGTKISAFVFCPPIFLSFIINLKKTFKHACSNYPRKIFVLMGKYFIALILSLTFALVSSPYLILAFAESKRILLYETSVATGASPVFYTRQFIDTPPILFQLQKIFPYALGWPIFTLGTLGFFLMLFLSIKSILKRKRVSPLNTYFLTLNTAFMVYFLSQAFLFCKWTRFMAPVLAFFPIFASFLLLKIAKPKLVAYGLIRSIKLCLLLIAIIPGVIFSSIYFQPDIRFTASEWIYQNIPSGSKILFDTGNVVDIPVSSPFPLTPNTYHLSPISFDFYHLDENPELFPKLLNYLESSDYIIIPSRRIFANHLRLPEKFPKAAKYYSLLFSGKLGFTETKRFVPFVSKVFGDEKAEETFSVFDHPTIRIYKKTLIMTKEQYEKLF